MIARRRPALLSLLVLLASAAPLPGQGVGAGTGGTVALRQAERMLGHAKRVLVIAAHPDDEDTELLTLLVRQEGAEAAYLSLTRGEGGQNLIGAELGEALGLIRSEELLAARRVDGARQYFTRAYDFGFSKRLEETLQFWPRDSLLKDAVRVIRRFRPQVVVSIFSGTPRDGHGQHQAAGWVAREAFIAAGDGARFPELAADEGLAPWAPAKLYRSARFEPGVAALELRSGILDPDIGQSYRQVAMRSRSLHRSQDMGVLQEMGPAVVRLVPVDGVGRARAGEGLWTGIDTLTIPATGIEADDQRRHRDEAAAIRHGIVADAWTADGRLVPGQSVPVTLALWNAGTAPVSVRWELAAPDGWPVGLTGAAPVVVPPGEVARLEGRVEVPAGAPLSSPYFLRAPRDGAMYRWEVPPALRGEPFDPPLLTARARVTAGAHALELDREVVHRYRDQAVGEVRRPLLVVPRVDVRLDPASRVWPVSRRGTQRFSVTLQHGAADTTAGEVGLELPRGWPAVPPQRFVLAREEERESFSFEVRTPATLAPGAYEVRAVVRDAAGRRYDAGLETVDYPHIRPRAVARAAVATVHAASIALPTVARIGYVRGAADRVPEALLDLGLPVELLAPAQLERADLAPYDAIVIGSRAFEAEPALADVNARLLEYARGGGRLIVQYQQHVYFQGGFAPRPLSLAASLSDPPDASPFRQAPRVTDERAPVRVLPGAEALTAAPNALDLADWDGWIQERGLYFARSWDPAYRPLLEMADPGEAPLQGALLTLPLGRGTFTYTGLSFFRQLPAGVPGALRLFLNLLDLRATPPQP